VIHSKSNNDLKSQLILEDKKKEKSRVYNIHYSYLERAIFLLGVVPSGPKSRRSSAFGNAMDGSAPRTNTSAQVSSVRIPLSKQVKLKPNFDGRSFKLT
jgi:hypothetical protein